MTPTKRATALPHIPGLDGLRGLAVIGVLAFHGGFATFKGGFLGVSTFFTLSGFLITTLLLHEHATFGTISLRAFWSRRFRRLLPAALAGMLLACLYAALFASPEQLANVRGDVLAALGYVANWRFVFAQKHYADLFRAPSPLQHYWSLAIEEQFYVLYPLVVVVALRIGGRRALTTTLVVLAGTSLALSVGLSDDIDRVYYGTDTRAFELLAGALFALWWTSASHRAPNALSVRARDGIGAVGLLASLAAWATVEQTSSWMPHGGFALQALATCALLLALTTNGTVSRLLSWAPLRAVGLISYGLYVYHWPVFLALNSERVNVGHIELFALRIALTIVLAVVSYVLLEQPIRRGNALRGRALRFATPTAMAAVMVTAIAASWSPPASTIAYANASLEDFKPRVVTLAPSTSVAAAAPAVPTAPTVPAPRTVMFVGDSGMLDLQPALAANYRAMGTERLVFDARPGFGLTSLAGSEWRSQWADLIDANNPDIVVVMFGKWDREFFESNGDEAYAALVDEAVVTLAAHGARVHWLAMLPSNDDPARAVNRVFERVALQHRGTVVYDDFEAVLRTGAAPASANPPRPTYGRVLVANGERLLLRKPDSWHLCPAGAQLLAKATSASEAERAWTPTVLPSQVDTSWRTDDAYNDPVGGCEPRAAGADS